MAGLLSLACVFGIAVIAYQAVTSESQEPASEDELLEFVVDAEAAQEIYSQSCLNCHGGNFEGGPAGPSLTNVGDQMERQAIVRRIQMGSPNGMPAFNNQLDEEQIKNLSVWLAEQTSSAAPEPNDANADEATESGEANESA